MNYSVFHSYDILLALTLNCWKRGELLFHPLIKGQTNSKQNVLCSKNMSRQRCEKGQQGRSAKFEVSRRCWKTFQASENGNVCVLPFICQHFGRACCRPIQGSSTYNGLPEEGDCKLRNIRTLYQSTEFHVQGDWRVQKWSGFLAERAGIPCGIG